VSYVFANDTANTDIFTARARQTGSIHVPGKRTKPTN